MTMLPAIATAHRSAGEPFPAGTPHNSATPANTFAGLLECRHDLSEAARATLPGIQAPVPLMGAAAAALTLALQLRSSHEQLFSFSELGMFGRNGAQNGPAPEQVQTPDVVGVADTAGSAMWSAGQSRVLQQSALQSSASRPGEHKAGPARSMRAAAVPLLARSGLLVEATATPEPSAPRSEERELFSLNGSGAVARPNLPTQRLRSATAVSVLVSGSDQALTIVARANGTDPAKICRLIEAAAAEFDVDVAEFHFNGSPTEPSFPSALGVNHGNRSN